MRPERVQRIRYPTEQNFASPPLERIIPKLSYHDLFELLDIIQKWDRKTDIDSQGAGIYGVLYYQLVRNYRDEIQKNNKTISKEILLSALSDTNAYIINNFGSNFKDST